MPHKLTMLLFGIFRNWLVCTRPPGNIMKYRSVLFQKRQEAVWCTLQEHSELLGVYAPLRWGAIVVAIQVAWDEVHGVVPSV